MSASIHMSADMHPNHARPHTGSERRGDGRACDASTPHISALRPDLSSARGGVDPLPYRHSCSLLRKRLRKRAPPGGGLEEWSMSFSPSAVFFPSLPPPMSHAVIHSPTPFLPSSLSHSPTPSFTQALPYSPTPSLTQSLTDSPTPLLTSDVGPQIIHGVGSVLVQHLVEFRLRGRPGSAAVIVEEEEKEEEEEEYPSVNARTRELRTSESLTPRLRYLPVGSTSRGEFQFPPPSNPPSKTPACTHSLTGWCSSW
eukprot:GHVU01232043.1.p1 GENE.GHVU01232043.1~~GHVU01232043.1.p1  ORF type:complete len:255 (+),score=15.10 GHVU01232043.1:552-1316(+)